MGETVGRPLLELARKARTIIMRAEKAGVEVTDGNVVDLIADNLPREALANIRAALVVAGYLERFPNACRSTR